MPNRRIFRAAVPSILTVILTIAQGGSAAAEIQQIDTNNLTSECEEVPSLAVKTAEEIEGSASSAVLEELERIERRTPESPRAAEVNALAVGELLKGNVATAAYLGTHGLLSEWRPLYVTNFGVYLVHLEKAEEAAAVFACARSTGYQSAALFEALAAAERALGNDQAAADAIDKAARLNPSDVAIAAERELIGSSQGTESDADDPFIRLADELRAFALSFRESLSARAEQLHALETAAGFAYDHDRDRWLKNKNTFYGDLEPALETITAQSSRSDYFYNVSLLGLVGWRTGLTRTLVSAPQRLELNSEWTFWARVAGMPEKAFVRELMAEARVDDGARAEERSLRDWQSTARASTLTLFHGHREHYDDAMWAARNPSKPTAEFCALWRDALVRLRAAAQTRLAPKLKNFDRTASAHVASAHQLIEGAQDFARRALAARRPLYDEEKKKDEKRHVRNLADSLDQDSFIISDLMYFIRQQKASYEWNLREYTNLMRLDGHFGTYTSYCEEPPEPEIDLDELSLDELEALMGALDAALRDEIATETKTDKVCDLSIGLFSMSVGGSSRVSTSVGPVTISPRPAGATVELGGGLGLGPLQGGVGIAGDFDRETQTWSHVVVQGSMAAGGSLAAGPVGVGCRFLEVSSRVSARALIQHDKLRYQIQKRLQRARQ